MGDFIQDLLPIGQIGGTTAFLVIGWLVITRKLTWHTDLAKVEKERDEWKGMTLQLLGVTGRLVTSAELSTEVIARADIKQPPTEG